MPKIPLDKFAESSSITERSSSEDKKKIIDAVKGEEVIIDDLGHPFYICGKVGGVEEMHYSLQTNEGEITLPISGLRGLYYTEDKQ